MQETHFICQLSHLSVILFSDMFCGFKETSHWCFSHKFHISYVSGLSAIVTFPSDMPGPKALKLSALICGESSIHSDHSHQTFHMDKLLRASVLYLDQPSRIFLAFFLSVSHRVLSPWENQLTNIKETNRVMFPQHLSRMVVLNHWGWVMHICISKLSNDQFK